MNRMKPYDLPHKGLRNALSQLQLLAGKTDYTNLSEVDKLYGLGKDVFALLNIHAEDENDITLAELEKRCPGCSDHDREDHEKLEKEQAALENLLSSIYSNVKEGNKVDSEGAEFYLLFSEYHAQYLLHTAEEERVTQAALYKHFTDEELGEFRTRIMKKNPPETLLLWFRYVVPAQSPAERIGLLKGFKMMATPELFSKGMNVIEKELSSNEFSELKLAVNK